MNDRDIQGLPVGNARPGLLELAETEPWLEWLERAKRPERRPTVFTVSEVRHLPAFQPDPEAVRFGLRRGEVGSDRARDDLGRAMMAAQTMFDKIWGRHVVAVEGACIASLGAWRAIIKSSVRKLG